MSLKELTKDKHTEAENTKFMKAVFKNKMPSDIWADYTYNKVIWYSAIESKSRQFDLLADLPGIERTEKLMDDYRTMTGGTIKHKLRQISIDYGNYISKLDTPDKILAHLYTWHMGDLHGGQMIKKVINAPHTNLDFDDHQNLIINLRKKLDDSLAEEANVAFDWAIKIMESYDGNLE